MIRPKQRLQSNTPPSIQSSATMSEIKEPQGTELDNDIDNDNDNDNDNVADEEDLEKLQAEIAKMEEEAQRIAAETAVLEKDKPSSDGINGANGNGNSGEANNGKDKDATAAEKAAVDKLSIYVGQVDYSATPEELLAHFEPCGQVERVTINCDKFSGRPKGFAYLEFQTDVAVNNALKLEGSSFKARTLKVTRKRVNDPNYYFNQMQQGQGQGQGHEQSGGRGMTMPPRGRGFGGRGRGFGGRGRGPPGGDRGGRRGGYRGGFRGGRGRGPPGGGGGSGYGYQPYY